MLLSFHKLCRDEMHGFQTIGSPTVGYGRRCYPMMELKKSTGASTMVNAFSTSLQGDLGAMSRGPSKLVEGQAHAPSPHNSNPVAIPTVSQIYDDCTMAGNNHALNFIH